MSQDKGKRPEMTLEHIIGQELQKCDSCERWDGECVRIRVSKLGYLKTKLNNFIFFRWVVKILQALSEAPDQVHD